MQQPAAVALQQPGQSEQYSRMVQSLWSVQEGWVRRAQVRLGPPVLGHQAPSPQSWWEAQGSEHMPQTQMETLSVLVEDMSPPWLK